MFVEFVEIISGNCITDAETWHGQTYRHITHNGILQRIHRHGLARHRHCWNRLWCRFNGCGCGWGYCLWGCCGDCHQLLNRSGLSFTCGGFDILCDNSAVGAATFDRIQIYFKFFGQLASAGRNDAAAVLAADILLQAWGCGCADRSGAERGGCCCWCGCSLLLSDRNFGFSFCDKSDRSPHRRNFPRRYDNDC